MKKKTSEMDDWLRPDYDLSRLTIVARGPGRKPQGKTTVALAPDVAKLFPTSEAVNEALRLLARIARESSSRARS
jgi:hypothetical protein